MRAVRSPSAAESTRPHAGHLHARVHDESLLIDDLERVTSHQVVVPSGLHDLQRPVRVPIHQVETEPHDRIGDEFFREMSPCRGLRRRVQGEHGGRAIVVQPLDQHPEDLAGLHGHTVTIGGHAREAIDEDAPRPDGPRLRQEQAVFLLDFLPEHRGSRRDDLHRTPVLEMLQVPAEGGGVLDEPVRRHLEGDDHSRLVELARAAIDELDAQAGLAGPRPPRDQDHVAARDAAAQYRVEPRNTRLHECSPHDLALSPRFQGPRRRRASEFPQRFLGHPDLPRGTSSPTERTAPARASPSDNRCAMTMPAPPFRANACCSRIDRGLASGRRRAGW